MAKLIDIGANLTDPVFRGIYRGKKVHADDFSLVLKRAWASGLQKIIVTGGSLSESEEGIKICESYDRGRLFCTVGCHPTRCNEFEESGNPDAYFESLLKLAKSSECVVAIGETGLDYDRLSFCEKGTQKRYFSRQFELAKCTGLPMFLHNRETDGEFTRMVRENRSSFSSGVVHSFTGTWEEARELTEDLNLYIGINGCSLKTADNLDVVSRIPLERIMLETDAPWCDVRPTHASFPIAEGQEALPFENGDPVKKAEKFVMGSLVKARNEPCHIVKVLKVVAALKGVSPEECIEQVYQNTCKIFFPS